jgi:hypothetical protein
MSHGIFRGQLATVSANLFAARSQFTYSISSVVKCGIPTPEPFAEFHSTGVEYKSEAVFTCLDGFVADPNTASTKKTCQGNGEWSAADWQCVG